MNHRKARSAPTIAPLIAAKSYLPRMNATTANALNAKSETPPKSPSSPSVSFAENALATMMNINIGTYHAPISKLPMSGTCITCQSRIFGE